MKQKRLVSMIVMLVVLISAVFFISSCTSTRTEELGRFTIISSKNVDLSRLGEMKRSSNRVETKRLNAKGLFIKDEKLSKSYQLENALDSALEQIPGAVAMVDAKVEYFYYEGIGKTQWGYKFEGTALIDPSLVNTDTALLQDDTVYFVSQGNGAVSFITEEEYCNYLN